MYDFTFDVTKLGKTLNQFGQQFELSKYDYYNKKHSEMVGDGTGLDTTQGAFIVVFSDLVSKKENIPEDVKRNIGNFVRILAEYHFLAKANNGVDDLNPSIVFHNAFSMYLKITEFNSNGLPNMQYGNFKRSILPLMNIYGTYIKNCN